jgi:ATP-binding cassette subfamily F protein uup
MPIVSLAGAHLAYGHVALLDAVDLAIEPGERIALIGRNGAGKSSLLKVLAGAVKLDDGLLTRASGVTVAYVPQEPAFDPSVSVFEAVAAGLGGDLAALVEYERLAADLAHAADATPLLERMAALQSRLEASGGWALKSKVERAIARLGLDALALVGTLSGGTIKRVALAHALVGEPALLLLDEPTNHLDIASIAWLEELLIGFAGAVVVVTHDRRFLDRVATRIVELDRGLSRSYPGSYAAYRERKAAELAAEDAANARFDKLLAQEEVWIRKGIEARRTRNEGRVRRLEQLRRERQARRDAAGTATLQVAQGERSGKLVAELVDVTKRFEDRVVVREFSTTILRGDKVGFIGPNGAGKSTLLKLILGDLAPDAGRVRRGTNLQVAYFDQMRAQLDDEATLVDTISPGSDYVEIDGRRTHVMTYLGEFLFPPERARSPVRTLSGGERNRLLLARLFARPANVLVLDEPTNDLDIETLELLEELLTDYPGTILLVSHDRTFLDNVVTSTIAAEGDGRWREYAGGYADYEAAKARADAIETRDAAKKPATPAPGKDEPKPAAAKPRAKLSYKEARELEALPAKMAALEAEQKTVEAALADATLYARDPERARALGERFGAIETELLALLERWEELEQRGG